MNIIPIFAKAFNIILFLTLVGGVHNITLASSNAAKNDPASSVMDTIISTLSSLTCETKGVGELLRSQFSHTCIPAPFFTAAVANMLSPGMYASAVLRLKINDKELFPNSCDRENRIDFNNQKLSFAMCNNGMLVLSRTEAIAKSAITIAKIMLTGSSNPWGDITKSWDIPKAKFHKIYKDQTEGTEGVFFDLGIPPIIWWKVIKNKDKMCLAVKGFSGWLPVGCKYIKEPYPISIYADFMDLTPGDINSPKDAKSLTQCSNMGNCFQRAHKNSRASIVMTGPLIECVKEMVAKLMISNTVCSFEDAHKILGSKSRSSSALFQFQMKMHKTVTLLLTIYVIFFGFSLLLSGDVPPKSEIVNFIIKFIFVIYFSVGINIHPESNNNLNRLDGMIEWVFPFLLSGMNQLGGWIINASPSDLCKFNVGDYARGLEHLALWDALDCRLSHYLGLDMVQTMIVDNATKSHDFSRLDNLSFPIPPYIYLLLPSLIGGNLFLFSLALTYPLLIISVAAFIVNATVVCMISIVVLGVLAPIFVPMLLFNYTKSYFETWVKMLISFMLQPMVAVVFMTTMLTIFDFGFYGQCKYRAMETTFPQINTNVSISLSGFGGRLNFGNPSNESRKVRYFAIDRDWGHYTLDEADSCKNSLGYILNNPLTIFQSNIFDTDLPWINDASGVSDKKRFDFLDGLAPSQGLFFNGLTLVFSKIKKLVISLLTACLVLYLMYHFSQNLAEFAADMTEGVSISSVSIGAQTLFKAGQEAMSDIGSAASAAGKGGQEEGGGAKRPGGESGDSVAAEGEAEEGLDSVSTGGDDEGGGADSSSSQNPSEEKGGKNSDDKIKDTVDNKVKKNVNSKEENSSDTKK